MGYIPPTQIRSPADETLREVPQGMYCKVAQNDATVVRGARNYPCMEFPGKRAPTVQLCRDPQGYVPLGTNPWRGPTVPYGTPRHRSSNDAAAEQVSVHSTGRRLRSRAARWSTCLPESRLDRGRR